MTKKTLRDIDVQGRKVFCRVDFNVPIENGVITNDKRIKSVLPTIQYLIDNGAKVILASHFGRPKGQVVEELRLTPVAERLSQIIHKQVVKVDTVIGPEVDKAINHLQNGDVVLLENVRFEEGEEKNASYLVEAFTKMADIFVNDAFGTAHRNHASTVGIAEQLPAVAGFLMEKEISVLSKALENPERPFTAIIGGSKVRDKIKVIDNLLDIVDHLIIGGGLACTFLKAQGLEIGNSLLEADKIELAKGFMEKAEKKRVQFHIQTDAVIADDFRADANHRVMSVHDIPEGWMVLDIGPETTKKYQEIISQSKLIIWNGPMGVFEMDSFSGGTRGVAESLAETSGYTIIGGGDSVAAIEKFGLVAAMNHTSTGGGASLEFMEGTILPGIRALDDRSS